MKRIENLYEVTHRLCGIIQPAGDSSIDAIRYQNLEDTINLTEMLIKDISEVSTNKGQYQASIIKAATRAEEFLNELKSDLQGQRVFTETQISHLQSRVHEITGDGEVMKLFNELLGINSGS